ncbi:hypothetical protein Lser_V15G16396 [Lactuca serriola]
MMQRYKGVAFGELDRHVFSIADSDFRVMRGDFIVFFNKIFDALCKLSADSDPNVQSASHLLDKLVKFIEEFISLLKEHMNVLNPYVRQFLVGWITVLDNVPDIDILGFLPDFLDGLFNMLSDSSHEIRQQADLALSEFLSESEKQLRLSSERSTWFTATLLQLGSVPSADLTPSGSSRTDIVASESVRDTGAVASSRAAEIGLDILAQTIQDDLDNITCFLILAREPIIPGIDKPYKTSLVFTLEEGPRVLFNAFAVFALREINLSKVTFSTTTFYLSR